MEKPSLDIDLRSKENSEIIESIFFHYTEEEISVQKGYRFSQ